MTGSVRPPMYGVAKVHKEGDQLRPILAMLGFPQHATTKWLAYLLEPVLKKYRQHVVKDSFDFTESIRQYQAPESVHICSFDINSLFTNVPLDETVRICTTQLYHSDIEAPKLPEKSFFKLIEKVTKGVEFSVGAMDKQKDGVAMGSPLGPVLANIFVGVHKQRLEVANRPELLMYKRYVDGTFSLQMAEDHSFKFFEYLNKLHPALQFSCKRENDRKLPIFEMDVHKKSIEAERETTNF